MLLNLVLPQVRSLIALSIGDGEDAEAVLLSEKSIWCAHVSLCILQCLYGSSILQSLRRSSFRELVVQQYPTLGDHPRCWNKQPDKYPILRWRWKERLPLHPAVLVFHEVGNRNPYLRIANR